MIFCEFFGVLCDVFTCLCDNVDTVDTMNNRKLHNVY